MKIKSNSLQKLGGLAVATSVNHWMATLDIRGTFYDTRVDMAHPNFCGPVIYVVWHEYMLLPFYVRGHYRTSLLIGRHNDAEWLAQAAHYMGFGTVRGSTNRGAASALRKLIRQTKPTNLVITPDGPRGPRRTMAQGPIFLSSRLNVPLVPVGVGYDRPRRLNSWDRFAMPRLASQARLICGPPIQIPGGLDRPGVEHYRQRVEAVLGWLTRDAEQWATTKTARRGERAIVRRTGKPIANYDDRLGTKPANASGVQPEPELLDILAIRDEKAA